MRINRPNRACTATDTGLLQEEQVHQPSYSEIKMYNRQNVF